MTEQRYDTAPGERHTRSDAHYPCDDDLVDLIVEYGSMTKVAAAVGVRRESLRDYLSIRPILKARMDEHGWKPMSPEVAAERYRQQQREGSARYRARNPEKVKAERRDKMRSYGPEYRHRWNHYNRLRRISVTKPDQLSVAYSDVIRRDPCGFCGAPTEEIDHIVPVASGGGGESEQSRPAVQPTQPPQVGQVPVAVSRRWSDAMTTLGESTSSGSRYDTSPLGPGPNWISKAGGF